ncbi:hypothetical protein [Nannocystis bainbridge]|uniref:Cytochrome c domain-containing protein n=1 Tax=Nannocystis bainbridge TaxID=2995303 RepID=A0ABT5DQR6_9BACT|nr:hypothetical protein [Nannocystis bainbridge]MDC0716006.1 hypothetical protein [Nannocystis bainbridge]
MRGLFALTAGCTGGSEPAGSGTTSGGTATGEASTLTTGGTTPTTSSTTGEPPPPPTACAEPTTLSAAPRTIAEAVAFINELPQPLTLDCFLERLERPLAIAATKSVISLQPAEGASSPRLFLFFGEFVMSVAVDGHGFQLLEFGEPVGQWRSIKAEVSFPLTDIMGIEAPFTRVLRDPGGGGTSCGVCHGSEAPAPEYPQAFASDALRFPDFELVSFADLRGEYERCDPAAQPERCARLTALFGHGEVEAAAFPEAMPTIYDYE